MKSKQQSNKTFSDNLKKELKRKKIKQKELCDVIFVSEVWISNLLSDNKPDKCFSELQRNAIKTFINAN